MIWHIISAVAYALLGIGCIAIATEWLTGVWHDVFLVIGGIWIGGFCATVAIIKMRLKGKGANN